MFQKDANGSRGLLAASFYVIVNLKPGDSKPEKQKGSSFHDDGRGVSLEGKIFFAIKLSNK